MNSRSGISLVEILIGLVIGSMVFVSALSGWLYLQVGFKRSSVQSELDIDVRIAMENFKQDLRLSALNELIFYPAGPGPHTAVSFPLARDDNGDGLIDLDGQGDIIWDQTVIYHVFAGTPNELRRTVIDPRDPSLSDPARYQQLENVVSSGTAPGASTTPLFANLFTWAIQGRGGVVDAYSAIPGRKVNDLLGSARLGAGNHDLQFRAVGKHGSSSGYLFGLDTLVASASQSTREAEAQQIGNVVGPYPVEEYVEEGTSSGNYQLVFSGASPGDSFELNLHNDAWETTNFAEAGYVADGIDIQFDPSLGSDGDFVLRLPGDAFAWEASEQTGDLAGTVHASGDAQGGAAIRVLIKGADLGGWIRNDGGNPWFMFRAPQTGGAMKIERAFVAESASMLGAVSPDTAGPAQELRFDGPFGPDHKLLGPAAQAWATLPDGVDFPWDADKTYAVSFLVSGTAGEGNVPYHQNADTSVVESYLIPGWENPDATDLADSNWTLKDPDATPKLFAVTGSWPEHLAEGHYVSSVFDTGIDSPAYTDFSWSEANESGTTLELRVRSGSNPEMTDASPWSALAPRANHGNPALSPKRYVQFRATLHPDSAGWKSPRLRDVRLSWEGEDKISDLSATYTTGPDRGVYDVLVDGLPLVRGVQATIEIYEDVPGYGGTQHRLTSRMTQEIEPRNTVQE